MSPNKEPAAMAGSRKPRKYKLAKVADGDWCIWMPTTVAVLLLCKGTFGYCLDYLQKVIK